MIGNLSRDVVADAEPRPGGAVFYAARAFARIGADARVVARCGAADTASLLPPLEALGVAVFFRPGERTTAFSFRYEGDRRVMSVDGVGDPWTVEDVTGWARTAIAEADWIQVGALLRSDFAAPTLAALADEGRRLLVDAQGLVRVARPGPLERDADVDPAILSRLSVLKLSESEAHTLAGGLEAHRLRALGVPEIVLTLGSAGARVITASLDEHVDGVPLEGVVDPTGAGDSFSAGYLHARAQEAEPAEAVRFANRLAAELLVS